MSAAFRNVFLKPSRSPSAASGVPGSVIATKLFPESTSVLKWRYRAFGSMVVPDFDETRNSVRSGVYRLRDGPDGRRDGRVEDHELGMAGAASQGRPENLRAQAAAAHPEQHDVAEAFRPGGVGERGQLR